MAFTLQENLINNTDDTVPLPVKGQEVLMIIVKLKCKVAERQN